MLELSALRRLKENNEHNRNAISKILERRKEWENIRVKNYGGSWATRSLWAPITQETADNLFVALGLLEQFQGEYKLTISGNWGYLYTNNTTMLEQALKLPGAKESNVRRAVVDRPKDTVRLRRSRHQYRTVLKNRKLTDQERVYVINWLTNNQANIRMGPALKAWLTQDSNIIQDYYFFDHNSMSEVAMLNLVHPGLVRRTQTIIR